MRGGRAVAALVAVADTAISAIPRVTLIARRRLDASERRQADMTLSVKVRGTCRHHPL
jgi:hypothetical protein